jgi:hypothetical protein
MRLRPVTTRGQTNQISKARDTLHPLEDVESDADGGRGRLTLMP